MFLRLSVIFVFICWSCQKTTREVENVSNTVETTKMCSLSGADIMRLSDATYQKSFFAQLDSVKSWQYPEGITEDHQSVDIWPEMLNSFLGDLNPDSLIKSQSYQKEYDFGMAPEGFTDPATCTDRIEISFDQKSCSFRMEIHHSFLVQPNWCTEHVVIYAFEITDMGVVNFYRNEAG